MDSSQEVTAWFWSTDRTCPFCKNPVDARLESHDGSTIADPDDRAKVQAQCRSCGKYVAIKLVELHIDNQIET